MSMISGKTLSRRNEFGLPISDFKERTRPIYTPVEDEEQVTQEQETVEVEQEEVETVDESSVEELSAEDIVARFSAPSEEEEEDREVDKYRRENEVLKAQLEERRRIVDERIRQSSDPSRDVKDEEESYVDFMDERILTKVEEIVRDEPRKLVPLFKAMVEQEAKKLVKEHIKPVTQKVSATDEEQKKIDLARKVSLNINQGLAKAKDYGDIPRLLVEDAERLDKENRVHESAIGRRLMKDPSRAISVDGVVGVVLELSREAQEKARSSRASEQPSGNRSTSTSGRPSNRDANMRKPNQTEADVDRQIIDSIKNAGTRKDTIGELFNNFR